MLKVVLEKIEPYVEDLGVGAFCQCIETPEARARKARRESLSQGKKFVRKKQTFGLNFGGTETVSLNLDGASLHWFVVPAGKGNNSGKIELRDVASVGAKAPSSFSVMSRAGDLLLELEAEGVDTRDEWVSVDKLQPLDELHLGVFFVVVVVVVVTLGLFVCFWLRAS